MSAERVREADHQREDGERASRRQFFREFGRQTVSGATSVLAGVEALRRTSRDAIDDLLDDGPERRESAAVHDDEFTLVPDAPYRSPFRVVEAGLEILDQRGLPGAASTITANEPSEVASALRHGLVSGGPVLGQIAAYSLAGAVARARTRSDYARRAVLNAGSDTLRAARPTSRALAIACDRMRSAFDGVDDGDADGQADALLAEADHIAQEDAEDLVRLARRAADVLGRATDNGRRPGVLMHGDLGPLTGGQVGPGTAMLQALAAAGHPAEVWLTEAAPLLEGRRAAWQLRALELPHEVVPDTALGWLIGNRTIDALLLRGEWVCANGDTIAPLGSLAAAQLARAAGIAVHALASVSALDPGTADASALEHQLRMPIAELGAGRRLVPAADLVPGVLLDDALGPA